VHTILEILESGILQGDWESEQKLLRPAMVHDKAVLLNPRGYVSQSLGPGLTVALAMDHPKTIHFVAADVLAKWGKTPEEVLRPGAIVSTDSDEKIVYRPWPPKQQSKLRKRR
jgi:hypothetical protein